MKHIKQLTKVFAGLFFTFSLQVAAQGLQPFSEEAFSAAQSEGKTVLLDFKASWCPTCKKQGAILETLLKEDELKDLVSFYVDYDTSKDLQKKLSVRKQSTLIVFKGHEEKARSTGETNKDKIRNLLLKGI